MQCRVTHLKTSQPLRLFELIWVRILFLLPLVKVIAWINRGDQTLQFLVNLSATFIVDWPGNCFEAQTSVKWVSFRAHPQYSFLLLGTFFPETVTCSSMQWLCWVSQGIL